MGRHPRLISVLVLLSVTVVWGATFALTKAALQTLSVFVFLTERFLIAFLTLLAICLLAKSARSAITKRSVLTGVALGLVMYGMYAFQTLGLLYTSASTAGFLTGLSVILVPLIASFGYGAQVSRRVYAAVCLATVGLGLLSGSHLPPAGGGRSGLLGTLTNSTDVPLVGVVLVFAAAICAALQVVGIDRYARNANPIVLATTEVGVLALCTAVTSLILHTPVHAWADGLVWPSSATVALIICAIPATALAYWAQNQFQQTAGMALSAIIFSAEPVFAALVAWWLLGERLSPAGIFGGLLVLGSMLLADESARLKARFDSLHQ